MKRVDTLRFVHPTSKSNRFHQELKELNPTATIKLIGTKIDEKDFKPAKAAGFEIPQNNIGQLAASAG